MKSKITCWSPLPPPQFLKSYLVEKSYSNYLAAIKFAFQLQEQYPKLRQALLTRMKRFNWYLSEQLFVLALADDEEIKMKMFSS
jgi:hypothetical protein